MEVVNTQELFRQGLKQQKIFKIIYTRIKTIRKYPRIIQIRIETKESIQELFRHRLKQQKISKNYLDKD